MTAHSSAERPSSFMSWLRLLRVPNVFTALADITMAYLVADGSFIRLPVWASLLAATSCLYLAGMVLNDYFDLEIDRRERPERPLPAGLIEPSAALRVGGLLWLIGVACGWAAHFQAHSPAPLYLSPGVLGTLLGVLVLLYDAKLKSTILGPLAMGACRAVNIWMGMSVALNPEFHLSRGPVMIACAFGLYVMGITWFARHESDESPRLTLVSGLILMVIGVAILTVIPSQDAWPRTRTVFNAAWVWPLLLWLMTSTVWRRAFTAIYTLQPLQIQWTVKQAILALIVLDALIALVVAGPYYALGILFLSFPATYLSRYIAMT